MPRRRRGNKPSTGSHSCSAAAPSPRARRPASPFSARTRKRPERWRRPTARCMCARRSGGMKRDMHIQSPDRLTPPLDGGCEFLETERSVPPAEQIMTVKPTPFTLRIADADIADLHDRLARARFPDQAPGDAWAYGTDVAYLRGLAEYWRSDFDWRAEEAALNAFPQFRVPLDGVDLHYLHVPGVGPDPMPLLLLHGWPGSVFEFLEFIPRLTHPQRFGGDARDAFTVVAPSLPGYGLSFRPGQRRFGVPEIADCVAALMHDVLGYDRFGAQGGDWRAAVSSRLGYAHADRMIGIQINLMMAASRDPSSFPNPSEEEQQYLSE